MIKQTPLNFKLGITKDTITPRAGLAMYSEFLRNFGLKNLIDQHLPAPGSNRGYKAWNYIEPILLTLYGGGVHIDDLREIAEDTALRKLIGLKNMPAASTVGDWLRRMGNCHGLPALKRVLDKINQKALARSEIEEFTLWSDPTLIASEKRDARMTYAGYKGYRPIITAFKELPLIVQHEFREGNEMGRLTEVLAAAYEILPKGKKIKHAALDSEFYTADVINFLSAKKTTFTIAADKDAAVKRLIERLYEWRPLKTEDGLATDREIAETVHVMGKSKEAFRLVVLRWQREQADLFNSEKYCYHAIASSLEGTPEEVVWRYNERGQAENVIKELKGGFGLGSLPSGDFGANGFWFALGVLAYNTFVLQKALVLPEEYWSKTIKTLRWSLIGVAGKVVRHGRRLWLLLAATPEKYGVYLGMRERCPGFA